MAKHSRWLVCLLLWPGLSVQARPFPYTEAGLNQRQAAVHLLQRMTFGVRSQDLARIEQMGLEAWADHQLSANLPETALQERLQQVECLGLEDSEIRTAYIQRNQLVDLAEKDGLPKFSDGDPAERRRYEMDLREFKQRRELSTVDDLFDQLRYQKLVRACYSENQLREVLTDFWFNHFNVAALNPAVRYNTLSYEQNLRERALGSFPDMLLEVARHPAMLYYLNNAQSSADPNCKTTLNARFEAAPKDEQPDLRPGQPLKRKNGGLNENFAREVLELHTLGVDGGYQQQDVTEVARALSGWTVFYREADNPRLSELIEPGIRLGYVRQGDFLFRADWHDADPKTILGQPFEAGAGVEEGEKVLRMLAQHPSTSRFIATKLAQRFVSDEPPPQLVERMAAEFRQHHGQIRPVILAMLESPEFWVEAKNPRKVKSPLEFFVSCVRIVGAELQLDPGHFYWLTRMGQPLYACGPPTGYPEDSRNWVSSSALLQRLNFATQLAEGRLRGISVDWKKLGEVGPEPVAALSLALLPERNVNHDPLLSKKLSRPGDGYPPNRAWFKPSKPPDLEQRRQQILVTKVIGVLLGSPEFQYR